MRNAIVAALVAAVVSAGSAGAAVGLIDGAKIRSHSIAAAKLTPAALRSLSFKPGSIVRVKGKPAVVQPNAYGYMSVECPKGSVAIGGGGWSDLADLDASYPLGSTGWEAIYYDYDAAPANAEAYVVCER